ncbi:helix-turn-helix domain-containing protein [Agrobacterium tumefaciens]|uniref:helix-turn-helix domain-containing protein n=1 Tax=Agrobacterium tumefaciens TaxID=358 RepID=UPI0022019756|nr:helix-turn-helix transcriptional regulator [Agrobacterium tumefaciens]
MTITAVNGENILKYYRQGVGLTQTQFATALGMPLRSYQDIESGKNPVRPIHLKAACWVLIDLASQSDLGLGFLPIEIEAVIKRLAKKS